MMRACTLCPRRCGADRLAGERGHCGLAAQAYWFREMLHCGVETELVPAHAIYLAGCNMECVFCTSSEWNAAPASARPWDAADLSARVAARREEGARTLLFVGGEPTASLPAVLELLDLLPGGQTVAWDSNMYASPEAMGLLDGVVDVYAADLKFGNDRCALELSGAPDYVATVTRNLRAAEQCGRLIVRHLLLPGHERCCLLPVLEWMHDELARPRLSLRGEYMPPPGLPPGAPLGRYVSDDEHRRGADAARSLGIELVE